MATLNESAHAYLTLPLQNHRDDKAVNAKHPRHNNLEATRDTHHSETDLPLVPLHERNSASFPI